MLKLKFRIRKFWYFNISFRTFIRYPRRYLIFISPASYSYKNNQKKFGLVWIRYCQNMTVPKKAHEILRGGPIFDHYRILSLKIWERSHVVIHAFLSNRIFFFKLMITWLQIARISSLVHLLADVGGQRYSDSVRNYCAVSFGQNQIQIRNPGTRKPFRLKISDFYWQTHHSKSGQNLDSAVRRRQPFGPSLVQTRPKVKFLTVSRWIRSEVAIIWSHVIFNFALKSEWIRINKTSLCVTWLPPPHSELDQ